MSELFRHIGPDTDVPAGDIGVGARENRLHVRPVQAPLQHLLRHFDRLGQGVRRQPHPHRGHRLRHRLYDGGHARGRKGRVRRQDVPGFGLGQRRQLRGREDQRAWRQGGDDVGFRGLHLRPGGHRCRQTRLGRRPQDREARPHRGVRQGVRRRIPRRRAAVDGAVRPRLPVRDSERGQSRRHQVAAQERLHRDVGGRQHADRPGRHPRLRRGRHSVRPVEGGQRRGAWRSRVWR